MDTLSKTLAASKPADAETEDRQTAAVDPALLAMLAGQLQSQYQHWQDNPDLAALRVLSAALPPVANAAAVLEWTGLVQFLQLLGDNLMIFIDDPEALSDDGGQLIGQALLLLAGYCRSPDDSACQDALLTVFASPEWPYCLDDDSTAELARQLQQVCPAVAQTAERQTACVADVALNLAADVDLHLLAMVFDELPPLTEQLAATLDSYQRRRDHSQLRTAQRQAHTLKGLAAMVGCLGIVNLTHHLEDLLEVLDKEGLTPDAELLACLMASADSLAGWAEALVQQQPAPANSVAVLQRVLDNVYRFQSGGLDKGNDTLQTMPSLPENIEAEPLPDAPPSRQEANADSAFVRVPMALLDELLRLVGENHNVLAQLQAQNGQLKAVLQGHRRHYQHQQRLLAELERGLGNPEWTAGDTGGFDSLEMQQFGVWQSLLPQVYEAIADSFETDKAALALARQSQDTLANFAQLHQASLQTTLDTRLIAADSVSARLRRTVRQALRVSGKQAELHIAGADTLLDSQLLAQLADPLMHLIRNAIDHGLETPEQRLAAGKPELGQITISFSRGHDHLTVICQDDGQGIDRAAVRRSAIGKGLLDGATDLSDSETDRLILLPGFSTRAPATELSGRGIGMDVVNQDISRLQGALDIRSSPGLGCLFTMTLPSSALLLNVLLVECGGQTVALTAYGIRQVLMSAGTADANRYQHNGANYLLYRLENLWDSPVLPATKRARAGVVLVQVAVEDWVAVHLTAIIGHREVVLKSPSPYLPAVSGLVGAATLSNSRIAPVLDLPALIRRQRLHGKLNHHALTAAAPKLPLILVVDDSLSARKTTADTLRDSGFQVITAVDGVDALKQLRHARPDLLVTDLEMPRMNGLELTALLKNQAETKALPILMISSRSSDKHRQQASHAGVDGYLSKPWVEAELLRQVEALLVKSHEKQVGA
ncbi:hybrid sensor histidine kinase/response regulator [Methylovulum miyakonense]|uniref:hybrid sensor histidine kinase/response regulator n=1 Tax=Methylovulum miyakonense TaxID=645578 RepID=UPI000368AD27|nr:response regulator [Methylovulum miyakonense]